MKLVSSAKLRKAQKAIEGMRPYEQMLSEILSSLSGRCDLEKLAAELSETAATRDAGQEEERTPRKTAIVAISSNSSLCGAFNSNAVRLALQEAGECEDVEIFSLGRKMSDALKHSPYADKVRDCSELVAHPSFRSSDDLARELLKRFYAGEFDSVRLVYNHFVSTASQKPVCEHYLPFEAPKAEADLSGTDYIIEPGVGQVARELLPQLLVLRLYAAILDSAAAEQAARTIAMQTASHNADNLLADLTLEYNKGRQQKITAEILDLLGGTSGE